MIVSKPHFKRLTWFSINEWDCSVTITDLNQENTSMQDLIVINNKIKRNKELLFTIQKPTMQDFKKLYVSGAEH
jgi:hypothetical protein